MTPHKRYCAQGHIIDGWRRSTTLGWRRYCRACNVLANERWRAKQRARRIAARALLMAC